MINIHVTVQHENHWQFHWWSFRNADWWTVYFSCYSCIWQLVEEEKIRGIVTLNEDFETEGITNSTEVTKAVFFISDKKYLV